MKVGDLVTTKRYSESGMTPGWIPANAIGVVIRKDKRLTTVKWLHGNTMPNGQRMSETTSSDAEIRLEVLSESK